MNLDNAVVYDIECFINCFTLTAETLNSDIVSTWEISPWRDDRVYLFQWFEWLRQTQTPMIGFNNENYDYPMIHYLLQNPQATNADLRAKSDSIIKGKDRFGHIIWPRDRFAPQLDLFKLNHFDNKAKTTTLKALQCNMRSPSVMDSPLSFELPVTHEDIDRYVIPYNVHDVRETKRFAQYNMPAINFRVGLIPQFGVDVMSYNDTKIGEKMIEQRLGEDVCYVRREYVDQWGNVKTRKEKRQTPRDRIALNDIIFPYIQFNDPEFQRVLDYLRAQVLTPDELLNEDQAELGGERVTVQVIATKGVFKGLVANVGGVSFHFGTGGIHASVTNKRFQAGGGWLIRDIDVASLYPSIAIVNRLAPAHLGEAFITEYAKLPAERKDWQKRKGKKCVEANSLKLAGNGAYGKTNSKFSFLYDPAYTMTVTINGQLMLCMLTEWLLVVPTLQIIQVNTDGITYWINEQHLDQAKAIEQRWQEFTRLTLEDTAYSRMWIADVNTYLAESADGTYKQKGRLWHPDPHNYAQSISECQPAAWHKDLSNVVSIRAAVAAMLHGIDPEAFIRTHSDPFDFMCRVKAERGAELSLGDKRVQNTTRYYVARDGEAFIKRMPPAGPEGQFKRAPKVSEIDYNRWHEANGNVWNEALHTKNRSTYETRTSYIETGWKVAECNDASSFDWNRVDYQWYVAEARKLIIA